MRRSDFKVARRQRRRWRSRRAVMTGTSLYRLVVRRSLKHIYAQIVDDNAGKTLVAASTRDKGIRPQLDSVKGKVGRGKVVGLAIAERAKERQISKVAFDRHGYLYHGRVKAVAEGAREGGLEF